MKNEEQFKNELDWLKANYPLIGDHDFKLDSVVHVTVGRIAELLYEHAFGCGRLGAAVSASPQPTKGCAQQWRLSGKLYAANTEHRFWTDERVEYFISQFFAAAPAQEPPKLPVDNSHVACSLRAAVLAFGGDEDLDKAVDEGRMNMQGEWLAAQEQPVESHPKTATRMRDGKTVEIQNDPDVIHPEHPGPDCGEKDYPRPPKKA